MLTNQYSLQTRVALLACLLVGGLLSTHSAWGTVHGAKPTQAAAKQEPAALQVAASDSQGKVSPYTRANRERAQAAAANGGKAQPSAARGGRKGGR